MNLNNESPIYECDGFALYANGTCLHKGKPIEWFQDERANKPWIPAKYKTFKSLVKGMVRDGDVTYKSDNK